MTTQLVWIVLISLTIALSIGGLVVRWPNTDRRALVGTLAIGLIELALYIVGHAR